MKVKQLEYHRNGICGEPFHVAIVTEGRDRRLVIHFEGKGSKCGMETITAAFDLAMLADGEIRFGVNSFRGDHYSALMRAAIAQREAAL